MLILFLKEQGSFRVLIGLFFLFLVIHIFLILNHLALPVAVIYGPLLLFIYWAATEFALKLNLIILHCSPFLLSSSFFIINGLVWPASFHTANLIFQVLSLMLYPGFVFYKCVRIKDQDKTRVLLFIEKLALLGTAIACFMGLLLLNQLIPLNFDVDPIIVVIAIMLVCVGLILWFFFSNTESISKSSAKINLRPPTIHLSAETIAEYSTRLELAMKIDRMFLDSNLSLERLSTVVNIPKNHISFVIINIYESNFYEWLAKYRIDYAMELLNNGKSNLKLEFLGNLCGFNSKTTFIRYFKLFIGLSPSDYRNTVR